MSKHLDFDLTKTLFISDLDGTLVGKGAEFPEKLDIPKRINALVNRGIRLTYATARTIQTVRDILAGIPFTAPVALMNGVVIRDMDKGEYLNAEYLTEDAVISLLTEMKKYGLIPFIYSLHNGELSTSHIDGLNPYMTAFMEHRIQKYNKPFTCLNRIEEAVCGDRSVIYVVMMDTYESLLPVKKLVDATPLLNCAFYKDSYETDIWYLEIFSANASKGSAVRWIKRMTGAETLVVFGDNRNDLPMFEASDFACAVENAPDEVKAAADLVIGSVDIGGVVGFLEKL